MVASIGADCGGQPTRQLAGCGNSKASVLLAFPRGLAAWGSGWKAHPPALCFAESLLDLCQQALPAPLWPGTWPTLPPQALCHWQLHK